MYKISRNFILLKVKMMVQLEQSTMESRILKILLSVYPITIDELRSKLHISMGKLEKILRGMEKRGLIVLEPLSDKTFVKVSGKQLSFVGRKPSQKKPIKHSGGKREWKEYEGFMFQ